MKIKTEKVAAPERPAPSYVNIYIKDSPITAGACHYSFAAAADARFTKSPGAIIKLEIDHEGDLVVTLEKEFN